MKKIKLGSYQGNAFYLFGVVSQLCKEQGRSEIEKKSIIAEMMQGDYDHLLEVFQREFPEVELV
jgi:hypothetical protein